MVQSQYSSLGLDAGTIRKGVIALTLMMHAHTVIIKAEMRTMYISRQDMLTAAGWTEAMMAVAPPLMNMYVGWTISPLLARKEECEVTPTEDEQCLSSA